MTHFEGYNITRVSRGTEDLKSVLKHYKLTLNA